MERSAIKDSIKFYFTSGGSLLLSIINYIYTITSILHLIKAKEPINLNGWIILGLYLVIFLWIIITEITTIMLVFNKQRHKNAYNQLKNYLKVTFIVPLTCFLLTILFFIVLIFLGTIDFKDSFGYYVVLLIVYTGLYSLCFGASIHYLDKVFKSVKELESCA